MSSTEALAGLGLADFDAWFGGSKVVDAEGNPLAVYHGTDADFSEFSKKRGIVVNFDNPQRLLGYFFTESEAYAAQYGKRILEVFLAIQNPFFAPMKKIDALENGGERYVRRWVKGLKDKGYDGLRFGDGEMSEWVAFSPGQIRIRAARGTQPAPRN